MRIHLLIPVFLLLTAFAQDAAAQKMKRGPEKQKNQITPQTGADKARVNRELKEAQYKGKRDHHLEIQDKATQKRMKANLKRAEKHSWGKEVPWYKRWFRRKKV